MAVEAGVLSWRYVGVAVPQARDWTSRMAKIPASLSKRLYVRESLRNTANGFELVIKNSVAPSTLIGFGPLTIDGRVVEEERLGLSLARPPVAFGRPPEPLTRMAKHVTPSKALRFDLNSAACVQVAGQWLTPGEHHISLVVKTKEVGDITIEATDLVTEGRTVSREVA